MHSGMIGKIEKARRYAEDRSRFEVLGLVMRVHGDNSDHEVVLQDGTWRCECDFFRMEQACAHTMAIEALLDGTVIRSAVTA